MTDQSKEANVTIRRLDSSAAGFSKELSALLAFEQVEDERIRTAVSDILQRVKTEGDAAILEYTERFDNMGADTLSELLIPRDELENAWRTVSTEQRDALQTAADRIEQYHQRQVTESWRYTERDGTVLGMQVRPLARVGLYVPGGRAAYPSSVLMSAIPAKVAGVKELIMVVPTPDGQRNPMVLAAAALAGVDRVYAIGGAQAVGGLAYGTQTLPQVDKIVGPGNAYVAEAKRQVFGTVGIDMIAGPSEVLIIADGTGNPEWVAMDLFAQAEHDEMAQSILLCTDEAFINKVAHAIYAQLPKMPRREIIARSLTRRGALIKVRDLEEACRVANHIAPEHLELFLSDAMPWVEKIHNAGAIFAGLWSVEALGDYCAGPSHVLPTMRSARFSSPLGVYDFQKRSSVIAVSSIGAQTLAPVAAVLGDGEGLTAHATSARFRVDSWP